MSAYDDAIIRRLQEARIDGEPVTLSEIKQLGGLYWEDCWRRVRRQYAIGEMPNEQGEQCFELAVEPDIERAVDTVASSTTAEEGVFCSLHVSSVNSSLDATPTLFQLPSASAIDPMLDEAA